MMLKDQLVIKAKEIKLVNPKGNQPWIFTGRTDAEAEAPILWPPDAKRWLIGKAPDLSPWERLRTRGEGCDRRWDGWMVSLTQWTWIWANSGRQWWTEKPGALQSIGSQRVRHNSAAEQQKQKQNSVCDLPQHNSLERKPYEYRVWVKRKQGWPWIDDSWK